MEDFTLSYHVTFPPGGDGLNTRGDSEVLFQMLGKSVSLRIDGQRATFKAAGVRSLDEAKEWLLAFKSGLFQAMLDHDLPFHGDSQLYEVEVRPDWRTRDKIPVTILGKEFPEGLDAFEDRPGAMVYPTGAHVARITLGTPTVSVARNWRPVVDSIATGASFSRNIEGRLTIGLDLFAAAGHEPSYEAQLLMYVMAIEALANPSPKHETAQRFIATWSNVLEKEIARPELADDERDSLLGLLRELNSRKEESVRSSVRRLVRELLSTEEAPEVVREALRRFDQVYDARSRLVHKGVLKPTSSIGDAKSLAKQLLTAALRQGREGGDPTDDGPNPSSGAAP